MVAAPSPLAGEGSAVLPRNEVGEGVRQRLLAKKPPHPFRDVAPPSCNNSVSFRPSDPDQVADLIRDPRAGIQ